VANPLDQTKLWAVFIHYFSEEAAEHAQRALDGKLLNDQKV